jgi:hypothetical protein
MIPDKASADPYIPMLSSSPSDLRRALRLKSPSPSITSGPSAATPIIPNPSGPRRAPSLAPIPALPYPCDKPGSDLAFHTGRYERVDQRAATYWAGPVHNSSDKDLNTFPGFDAVMTCRLHRQDLVLRFPEPASRKERKQERRQGRMGLNFWRNMPNKLFRKEVSSVQ